MTEYKQERPSWCPHESCIFKTVTGQHSFCVGELPEPEPHGGTMNTHRMCIHGAKDDGEWIFDLQINSTDVWWIQMGFDRVFN